MATNIHRRPYPEEKVDESYSGSTHSSQMSDSNINVSQMDNTLVVVALEKINVRKSQVSLFDAINKIVVWKDKKSIINDVVVLKAEYHYGDTLYYELADFDDKDNCDKYRYVYCSQIGQKRWREWNSDEEAIQQGRSAESSVGLRGTERTKGAQLRLPLATSTLSPPPQRQQDHSEQPVLRRSTRLIQSPGQHESNVEATETDNSTSLSARFLMAGIDPKTPILNIPLNKMGAFLGVVSSSSSGFPSKVVPLVRRLLIKLSRDYLDNDISDALPLIKLQFAKFVLCSSPPALSSSEKEKRIRALITKIDNGEWRDITLESLTFKKPFHIDTSQSSEKRLHNKVAKCIQYDNVSKAYKVLNGDTTRVPGSNATVQRLLDYHPEKRPISDADSEELNRFHLPEDIMPVTIDSTLFRTSVTNTKSLTEPGIDGFRAEHLKQLTFFGSQDTEKDAFVNATCEIYNIMLKGSLPSECLPLFRNTHLIAIPKDQSDLRPLGLQSLDRKLICSALLNDTRFKKHNIDHFKNLQLCFQKRGCEEIIHFFSVLMQTQPSMSFLKLDGYIAYQNISRDYARLQIQRTAPFASPLVDALYGDISQSFYMSDDGIITINSSEGCHQGCKLASWFYSMALQPLLEKIDTTIKDGNLESHNSVKALMDDIKIAADFEGICKSLRTVISDGPTVGYFLKKSKTVVTLGSCNGNIELASEQKRKLISEFELLPHNILIHPDDVAVDLKEETSKLYGLKMLGSFIGSSAYVSEQLTAKGLKLNVEAEKLCCYPHIQDRLFLARLCFLPKGNYTFRTTTPYLSEGYLQNFEVQKKKILLSILGSTQNNMSDDTYKQCCLPTNKGGLGLQFTRESALSAFIASFIQAVPSLHKSFPLLFEKDDSEGLLSYNLSNTQYSLAQDLISSIEKINLIRGNEPELQIQSLSKLSLNKRLPDTENDESFKLQNHIYKIAVAGKFKELVDSNTDYRPFIAFLTSECNDFGGTYLNSIPKNNVNKFNNAQFRAALQYRLFERQEVWVEGTICNCKSRTPLDAFGHHFANRCAKEGYRHAAHDKVARCLQEMFIALGQRVVLEPKRLFQDSLMKPDIISKNYPKANSQVIFDVTITEPSHSTNMHLSTATTEFKAGEEAHLRKMQKYGDIATEHGYDFIPLVFESTGRPSNDVLKVLRTLFQNYREMYQIPHSVVANMRKHWTCKLSATLQRSLADSIVQRSRYANAGYTKATSNMAQLSIHGEYATTCAIAE